MPIDRNRLLALESDLLARLRDWPESEWTRLVLAVELMNVRYFLRRVS